MTEKKLGEFLCFIAEHHWVIPKTLPSVPKVDLTSLNASNSARKKSEIEIAENKLAQYQEEDLLDNVSEAFAAWQFDKGVSLGRKEMELRIAIVDFAGDSKKGFLTYLKGDSLLVLLKDRQGFGIAIRSASGIQGLFELRNTKEKQLASPSGSMSASPRSSPRRGKVNNSTFDVPLSPRRISPQISPRSISPRGVGDFARPGVINLSQMARE